MSAPFLASGPPWHMLWDILQWAVFVGAAILVIVFVGVLVGCVMAILSGDWNI